MSSACVKFRVSRRGCGSDTAGLFPIRSNKGSPKFAIITTNAMKDDKRLKRKVRNSYIVSTVSITLVLFLLGSVT